MGISISSRPSQSGQAAAVARADTAVEALLGERHGGRDLESGPGPPSPLPSGTER